MKPTKYYPTQVRHPYFPSHRPKRARALNPTTLTAPDLKRYFDAREDLSDPMAEAGGSGGRFPGGHPLAQFSQQSAGAAP